MSAVAALLRGRVRAEALMVDACTIRPATAHATDTSTGVVSTTYGDPVYSGRCKVQRLRGAFPSNPEGGEHRWTVAPAEVHVPVAGTAGIRVGHLIEITASLDPNIVGRLFRVRSGDRKTFQTAIRLQVEEVVN
jgi:hypothetical protein